MLSAQHLFKAGLKLADKNAPAILTAFGAIGAVSTAVLASRASFKAADVIREAEVDAQEELSKIEKVKLVWPLYISAVGVGTLTCTSILMSHRISSRRAAMLAAAYALNEGKLEEYQQKVKEHFGIEDEKAMRHSSTNKQVASDVEDGTLIFDPLEGRVMIRDEYSGRYFYGKVDDIDRAVNEINALILREDSATLSEFYRAIGLETVSTSDNFGWTPNERLELDWNTSKTPDGRHAVHTFEFVNPPVMNPGGRGGAYFR